MNETKGQQVKCYFIAKENFTAERRRFIKGESYPVFIQDDYFVLVSENGEFNLTEKGLSRTIEGWKNLVDVKEADER